MPKDIVITIPVLLADEKFNLILMRLIYFVYIFIFDTIFAIKRSCLPGP